MGVEPPPDHRADFIKALGIACTAIIVVVFAVGLSIIAAEAGMEGDLGPIVPSGVLGALAGIALALVLTAWLCVPFALLLLRSRLVHNILSALWFIVSALGVVFCHQYYDLVPLLKQFAVTSAILVGAAVPAAIVMKRFVNRPR